MADFSFDTEGMRYYEQYCSTCMHDPTEEQVAMGKGCSVMFLQLFYNDIGGEGRHLLDEFIPTIDGKNGQCSMHMTPELAKTRERELLEKLGQQTFIKEDK